jgi:hypothetical protein
MARSCPPSSFLREVLPEVEDLHLRGFGHLLAVKGRRVTFLALVERRDELGDQRAVAHARLGASAHAAEELLLLGLPDAHQFLGFLWRADPDDRVIQLS